MLVAVFLSGARHFSRRILIFDYSSENFEFVQVLDGLGSLIASGYADDIRSIRGHISGDPQTVVFGDEHEGCSSELLLKLVKEPARRLPFNSPMGLGAAADSS